MNRLSILFAIDLRSLAAVRIMCALTMLWCLRVWLPDLAAFFTDDGLVSREVMPLVDFKGRFSLFHYIDGALAAHVVWFIGLIAALSLLVGYRARLAALVAWVVYLSFVGRNALLVQGGDTLMPLLLFWCMFLPIGAVYSVDAALDPQNRRSDPPYLSVATVGLLLQVLYVYVYGALLKSGEAWIPNGSAVYAALHLDTFATPFAYWLRQYLIPMQLLTIYVFYLELLAPVLLYFPDRKLRIRSITLALLMLMHLGFRVFLHIGHFWLASLSSLCAYIPSGAWDRIAGWCWRPDAARIAIHYDRDCGFCLRTALVLREAFLPRAVTITPAQDDPALGAVLEREVSWIVVTPGGDQLLHWDAVAYVMGQCRLLAPLGWLAWLYGRVGLGRPTYDLIGRNRRRLGRTSGVFGKRATTMPRFGWPVTVGLAVVIAFCFVWNLKVHYEPSGRFDVIPSSVERGARALGLTQRWNMFAPSPPTLDAYPVLVATTADGAVFDAFRGRGAELSFVPPDDILALFPSHRWRAFILRSWHREGQLRDELLGRLAAHYCDALNDGAAGGDRVATIRPHYVVNQSKSQFQDETWVEDFTPTTCGAPG